MCMIMIMPCGWLAAGFTLRFLSGEKLLGYRLHGANTIREQPLAAIEENMRLLLGWLKEQGAGGEVLQGLAAQLQDLYRYTREEWLTIVHQRLTAREQELFPLIAERDAWVAERNGWIAERDQLIASLQQQLAQHQHWLVERDAWVEDRNAWIAERDQHIASLQQQLAQHQHWLTERDRWVEDRNAWIAERDALIQHQTHQLSARDHWVADRDRWITERDTLIAQLQQQQQALLASRAFRLGQALLKPLRRCKQVFAGGEPCLKS